MNPRCCSLSFSDHAPHRTETRQQPWRDRRIFADVSPGRSEDITPLTDGNDAKTFQVVSRWLRLSSVLIGSDRLINNPQLVEG